MTQAKHEFKFKVGQQVKVDLNDGWEIKPLGVILNRRSKQTYNGSPQGMRMSLMNEYLVEYRGVQKEFSEVNLEDYADTDNAA